jgi:hypothetical protein
LELSIRASRFTLRENSLYAVLAAVSYLERVVPGAALALCLKEGEKRETMFDCAMEHTVFTELWHTDSVMQVGEDRFREVRETVKNMIQTFILEYLRAGD